MTIDHLDLEGRQMPGTHARREAVVPTNHNTRSAIRMSSMVKTVFSVAAGLLVIACAGGGYLVYQTKKAADDAITSATYGKIKKGDSQDSVRKLIGGNHEAAKIAVKDTQPAVPAGSACDYALEKSSDHAYRFCYIGGKLVQKDEIKMADGSKK